MHYEDQARRFTLLSGFLFGTLVGTGLALLSGPARALGDLASRELQRRRRRKAWRNRWMLLQKTVARLLARGR